MKFSVPYNGDKLLFEKLEQSGLINFVEEVYFAGNPEFIKSGRRPKIKDYIICKNGKNVFDSVEYDYAISTLIKKSNEYGIKCNLLMNFDSILTEKTKNYVSNLILEGVSILTVGSIDILKQVKKKWPNDIEIQNSVYIQASTVKEVEKLISFGVSIVLISPDINDNLNKVSEINKLIIDRNDLKLKIMLNEGCIKCCPHRKNDQIDAQEYTIENTIDDYTKNTENARILLQPCRSYMNKKGVKNTNYIHPVDIPSYRKFNPILKIVGRSFSTDRILESLNAYVNNYFDGDLRDIVENFKHSQEPVFSKFDSNTRFLINS